MPKFIYFMQTLSSFFLVFIYFVIFVRFVFIYVVIFIRFIFIYFHMFIAIYKFSKLRNCLLFAPRSLLGIYNLFLKLILFC